MFRLAFLIFVCTLLAVILVTTLGVLLALYPPTLAADTLLATVIIRYEEQGLLAALQALGPYIFQLLMLTWVGWLGIVAAGLLFGLGWMVLHRDRARHLLEKIYFLEDAHATSERRCQTLEESVRMAFQNLDTSLNGTHGEAYLVMDADGRVTMMNEQMCRLLSPWLGEDFVFQPGGDMLSRLPSELMQHLQQGYAAITQGQGWAQDLTCAPLTFRASALALPHKEGGLVGLFLLRDVSVNHVLPEDKDVAVLMNQHILGQAPAALALLDPQGRVLELSAVWRKLFRVADDTWRGQDYAQQDPCVPVNWVSVYPEVRDGRRMEGQDKLNLFGEEKTLRWQVSAWEVPAQGLGGMMVLIEDLTAQNQAARRLAQLEEQENKLAYNDLLTGLPNRQLFHDRLNMALAMAYRQLNKVALLFLDLDGFKAVNDTLGHDVGDLLLKEVAMRLQDCVRRTDTVARLGGDEFTVVLHIRDQRDAEQVAAKIIEKINLPYALGAHDDVRVGTSIGIALYPEHATAAADLIKMADAAMYAAKQDGKNQYKVHQIETAQ